MRTSQASQILAPMMQARFPVLLTGAPGVGKTDIVHQATLQCDMDLVISHPVVSDPTDAKGLPFPALDNMRANFLPIGEVCEVLDATTPTVWFWDDFGQASPAVQAAYMQWLLARRVGSHILPDCVTIVCATNRRQDRAGVTGILEPVKSRFVTIINIEASLDDWTDWALETGAIDPIVIAFLRNANALPGTDKDGRPIELFSPEATSALMENSPSPRTWHNVSKLYQLALPKELQLAAYSGAVGEGAAVAFSAYASTLANMVSLDRILLDPHGAPLPQTLQERFAVCTGLASKCDLKLFGRIATYVERIMADGHGEFSALAVKDCVKRCPDIGYTSEWNKLIRGPIGAMMLGADTD